MATFTSAKIFPVLKEKKTCPIDFAKYVGLVAKSGHEESVQRLTYLLDETRTRLAEQLTSSHEGNTKFNVKPSMEPKKTVIEYLGILKGLSELELQDTDEEKRNKTAKQTEEEDKAKAADHKEGKTVEKKDDTAKTTESKGGFKRTPATMLGFRWTDLASADGKYFRNVNVWHEQASVLLALAVCVTNQAPTEAKGGGVAEYATAAKTALAAAGICEAALAQFNASNINGVLPPDDLSGGFLLQALVQYNLAVAQEMLIHRCLDQGQSPGLVASLCSDAAARYGRIPGTIDNLTVRPSKTMRALKDFSKVKASYMGALGFFCLGKKRAAVDSKEGCTAAIKNFEKAVELAGKAAADAKGSELKTLQATVGDLEASMHSIENGFLNGQKSINDSVYFATLPEDPDPPAEAKSLVEGKATKFFENDGLARHPCFADQNLAFAFVPTKSEAVPGPCTGEEETEDMCVLL